MRFGRQSCRSEKLLTGTQKDCSGRIGISPGAAAVLLRFFSTVHGSLVGKTCYFVETRTSRDVLRRNRIVFRL